MMHNALTAAAVLAGLAAAALSAPAAAGDRGVAPTSGERLAAMLHAEGAQIYECALDAADRLDWRFREPVATLIRDGETVGSHAAGPVWRLSDGGFVAAKPVARVPGATPSDLPLLRLEAAVPGEGGLFAGVRTILRINTKGGVPAGRCDDPGALLAVPYSADYAFYGPSQPATGAGPYGYLFGVDDPAPARMTEEGPYDHLFAYGARGNEPARPADIARRPAATDPGS